MNSHLSHKSPYTNLILKCQLNDLCPLMLVFFLHTISDRCTRMIPQLVTPQKPLSCHQEALQSSPKKQVSSLEGNRIAFHLFDAPIGLNEIPTYPPVVGKDQKCPYCNFVGDKCRRSLYGLFCWGVR